MADPIPSRSFNDPARQAAALLVRLGLAVLAVGVPTGSLISRRAIFTLMPVGAALILIGVLLDPKGAHLARLQAALFRPLGLVTLFLLGWALLSLVWTPFIAVAGERYVKSAGTLLFAMIVSIALPPHTKTSNLYLLPLGLAIGAIATTILGSLISADGVQDLEGSTLDRAALTLSMMVWPALAALAVRDRWMSAGLLAVAVAVAVIAVWLPSVLGALAAGALVFSLCNSAQLRVGRMFGTTIAILILCAPAIPFALAPLMRSATHGFAISMQTAEAFFTAEGLRLIAGHGFDTFTRGLQMGYLPSAMPRNIIFEIWYELGLLGAASAALVVWTAFWAATSYLPKPLTGFVQGALVCGFILALTGLVTLQIWWLTILAVAGILFTLVAKGQYRTQRPAAKSLSASALRPQI